MPISRALRLATEWGPDGIPLLASKPKMPSIRVANMKDRVISPEEEAAIFAAIEERRIKEPGRPWWLFGRMVRWLLDTGMRLSEALDAGTDQVSSRTVGGRVVHFLTLARYRTKNDKPRTIPLTERIVAELGALKAQATPRKVGDRPVFFPLRPAAAWYMFNQIREDVKRSGFDIDAVTLHTFRHTCLTRLAQGGMDIMRLKEWAGHSDIKITAERYLHLVPSDLVRGLDFLDASDGGKLHTQSLDRAYPVKPTVATPPAMRAKSATGRGDGTPRNLGNSWRRGWDSNPRYGCPHNGFRDRPNRPLWHLSA